MDDEEKEKLTLYLIYLGCVCLDCDDPPDEELREYFGLEAA